MLLPLLLYALLGLVVEVIYTACYAAAEAVVEQGVVEASKQQGLKTGLELMAQQKQYFDMGTALTQSTGQVTTAGANFEATRRSTDAQLADNDAKRFRLLGEMFQDQLEEENQIIQMLMESKNKTVDAVIKMMNASFGTSQKIMAAGMAR